LKLLGSYSSIFIIFYKLESFNSLAKDFNFLSKKLFLEILQANQKQQFNPFYLPHRHLQIFNQNEFFRGISLPVPPTLETLESKMPARTLQNPYAIDFLKVKFTEVSHAMSKLTFVSPSLSEMS
jgi:hypothetical protein